jgi:hypothetical protein
MSSIRIIDSHLGLDYLKKYKVGDYFIETGTYRGDTIYIALEAGFDFVYSCEIYKPLYENAVEIFKENSDVHIMEMESPEFIEHVLRNEIGGRAATFWLDAHASGPLGGGKSVGTPVLDELRAIRDNSTNKGHTILIDDRRLFGCGEWGGVTETEALEILNEINPNYKIAHLDGVIEKDILCAYI